MQFSLTYLSLDLSTEQQVIPDTIITDENTLQPLILSCFYPLLCSFGKLKDFCWLQGFKS